VAALDPQKRLSSVDWRVREHFVAMAKTFSVATGMHLQVRSARRSCAEQADLYAYGRTHHIDKPPITYARGCSSWHVLGRAIDADVVDAAGKLRGDCKLYTLAGQLWEKQHQGVWGGRFGGFGECGDAGHFEWHPDVKMADLCPSADACSTAEVQIATVKPGPSLLLSLAALGLGSALGYLALNR
jgi:hypothetical protein